MGSPDLFRALTHNLKGGDAYVPASQDIRLTPHLSIVVAILYMMAADGDLSDRESSQLQSVIGADAGLLRRAVAYAETHTVDRFLEEAPGVLDGKNRLCLLLNVCDSLMADGQLEDVELQLFDRLLVAMGHTNASFQPYFDVIAIKDRMSVLGDFAAAESSSSLTPPMALVVSMLYMMASDGSMDEEEIGRLNAAVGNSPALLKAGLRYVSQVRAPQFLASAAGLLNERQRMCVLLNVCDTMLSDHKVANAERDLFRRMLAAFTVDEKSFDKYLNLLYLKNDLPQDDAKLQVANRQPASGIPARKTSREEGKVFERKHTWEEETGEASDAKALKSSGVRGATGQDGPHSEVNSHISRTMQDNIDRMSQGFDDGVALKSLEKNSRGDGAVNDEKLSGEGPADIRAYRDGEGASEIEKTDSQDRHVDFRNIRDAQGSNASGKKSSRDGPIDPLAYRDAQADSVTDKKSAQEGLADLRSVRDAQADDAAAAGGVPQGPADLRSVRDADTTDSQEKKYSGDGPIDFRVARDANAEFGMHDANDKDSHAGRHWQDAALPGGRRELLDADPMSLSSQIVDDRKSFDGANDAVDGQQLPLGPVNNRMDAVSDRTRTISAYLEVMQAAKSIFAASRLPLLPTVPVTRRPASIGVVKLENKQEQETVNTWDDGSRMLLASDQGGPIMSESQGNAPANKEEASLNRRLRYSSAVLLPALFLAYGATMVGETASEHTFVTQENMATDARIVHQMASVQQTVYRIAPESVKLSVDKLQGAGLNGVAVTGTSSTGLAVAQGEAMSAADAKELSDRKKADNFLEQRKQELMVLFQQHQGASALAAERKQWFVYAKSIVLLGLGMAFWGVLFRSMRMMHFSTAAGVIGLLLTANGYWLFMRF